MPRVLYLSQNGMTEPLGQSQVIAYAEKLAARGVRYDIVSMEPPDVERGAWAAIRNRLARAGIAWHPMRRTASPAMAAKVADVTALFVRAAALALKNRHHIVHARAHFPGPVAQAVAIGVPRARFLFDCRALLGDEYVDVGHWTRDRPEYRLLKAWERLAFRRADGLVVLTRALEAQLLREEMVVPSRPRAVIPCCVDMDRFRPQEADRTAVRAELGLGERTIAAYAGGLGAWYLDAEMAQFLGALRGHRPDLAVLVMTHASTGAFQRLLAREGFGEHDVVFRRVPPDRVPRMLAAADVGLSLVKPSSAVVGRSPTKIPEYLASGLLTIANAGVGDVGELREEPGCVVLAGLGGDALAIAARTCADLLARSRDLRVAGARDVAARRFSLTAIGVPRYEALYEAMLR